MEFSKIESLKNKLTPQTVFGILFTAGCVPFVVYLCLRLTFADEYSELSTFFMLSLTYVPPAAVVFYLIGWSIGKFYYASQGLDQSSKIIPSIVLLLSACLGFLGISILYFLFAVTSASQEELKNYWSSRFIQKNPWIVSSMASNHSIDPELLTEVIQKIDSEMVYRSAAINPKLTEQSFKQLAQSSNSKILADLAKNPSLPQWLAAQLSNHSEWMVLKNLSLNLSLKSESLQKLSLSSFENIRMNTALHPNTDAAVLERLSLDLSENVRRSVAANKNTPLNILEKLSTDPSGDVRYYLTKNPQAPHSIFEKLVEDADERARNSARNILGRH